MWIPEITLLILGVALSGVSWAGEVPSAAQAGVGGASLADPRDNSEITINPAAVALTPRYDVQGQFVGGPTGDLRWNGSVVDGRTSKYLAFGLAYNGGIVAPPFRDIELPGWGPAGEELRNSKQQHDITIALAAPFLDRRLAIGLNGTLSIFNGEYVGKGVTGNLDFGFSARPIEFFSVGLVGKNLLPVVDQPDTPTTIGLGVRGGKEELIVGMVDLNTRVEGISGSRFDVGAGVQGTIAKMVDIRGGYAWAGELREHSATWGLGLHSKLGALDYSMNVPVLSSDWTTPVLTHYVTLTLFTKLGDKAAESEPVRFPGDRR